MSVVIRLSKMGRKGEARYRMVVMEKRTRRNGRPIEILGRFEKSINGSKSEINKERYNYWISQGAQPSITVSKIINT